MLRLPAWSECIAVPQARQLPGAGGSADTVGLLAALIRHDPQGAALGVLHDAEAAAAAHSAGVGAGVTIGLGAKSCGFAEAPIKLR
jgi:microcystin degradation protein MlrC